MLSETGSGNCKQWQVWRRFRVRIWKFSRFCPPRPQRTRVQRLGQMHQMGAWRAANPWRKSERQEGILSSERFVRRVVCRSPLSSARRRAANHCFGRKVRTRWRRRNSEVRKQKRRFLRLPSHSETGRRAQGRFGRFFRRSRKRGEGGWGIVLLYPYA